MAFKEAWGKQYPSCVKSWEENWDILSTFYAYPPEIRKIIYTTNIIEGLNRQFRKITKNKPSFTNDDSLRKILYLASKNIVEHGTARCRNWDHPTICGTGMEDYFGGSWSFASNVDGRTVENTYCTPYLGYPFYSSRDTTVYNPYHNNDAPPMRSFYRWHIPDPIFFERDLRVTVQQIGVCHRGLFERQDDVSSVAYWYQSEPHGLFPSLSKRELRWPR